MKRIIGIRYIKVSCNMKLEIIHKMKVLQETLKNTPDSDITGYLNFLNEMNNMTKIAETMSISSSPYTTEF